MSTYNTRVWEDIPCSEINRVSCYMSLNLILPVSTKHAITASYKVVHLSVSRSIQLLDTVLQNTETADLQTTSF